MSIKHAELFFVGLLIILGMPQTIAAQTVKFQALPKQDSYGYCEPAPGLFRPLQNKLGKQVASGPGVGIFERISQKFSRNLNRDRKVAPKKPSPYAPNQIIEDYSYDRQLEDMSGQVLPCRLKATGKVFRIYAEGEIFMGWSKVGTYSRYVFPGEFGELSTAAQPVPLKPPVMKTP